MAFNLRMSSVILCSNKAVTVYRPSALEYSSSSPLGMIAMALVDTLFAIGSFHQALAKIRAITMFHLIFMFSFESPPVSFPHNYIVFVRNCMFLH